MFRMKEAISYNIVHRISKGFFYELYKEIPQQTIIYSVEIRESVFPPIYQELRVYV